MKKMCKFIWAVNLGVCAFLISCILLSDMDDYNSLLESNYKTPWFSNNWLTEPYTMYMLSGEPVRIYWTKNVIGDDWHIKEITHKNKKFWTVLKKRKGK